MITLGGYISYSKLRKCNKLDSLAADEPAILNTGLLSQSLPDEPRELEISRVKLEQLPIVLGPNTITSGTMGSTGNSITTLMLLFILSHSKQGTAVVSMQAARMVFVKLGAIVVLPGVILREGMIFTIPASTH